MSSPDFYSCFISYSHKDEDFCQALAEQLRSRRLSVFLASDTMRAGKKLHEQIKEAIRTYDKLLLVLSSESMRSEWVSTEIYEARQREVREGRRVLFPIRIVPFDSIKQWACFDADTGKDLAREVREYLIPDFEHWRDAKAFKASVARLVNDLRRDIAPH